MRRAWGGCPTLRMVLCTCVSPDIYIYMKISKRLKTFYISFDKNGIVGRITMLFSAFDPTVQKFVFISSE
jgi:hypothetical protein